MSDQTFWKATRPDGTDFYSGTIDYAAALTSGRPVTVREVNDPLCCTGDVLHAATVPAETLIGGDWPCRLFEVTGVPVAEGEQHKRGFFSLTVLREVDAHLALGPQGEHVAAMIERARQLRRWEVGSLRTAWYADRIADRIAARDAAWIAAGDAARGAAGDAAWVAAARTTARGVYLAVAWEAAKDTTRALVVRDLIGQHGFTQEHYDTLTRPWRTVVGPLHPDDKDLKGQDDECGAGQL